MKSPRIYIDTSAIGGYFDKEFIEDTRKFFSLIKQGKYILLVSTVVFEELKEAPVQVRELLSSLPSKYVEEVAITPDMFQLRDAYLEANIVSKKYRDDALHVAIATTTRAEAIVSWNFKHLVKFEKIKGYNVVNLSKGYGMVTIITPKSLIS